MNRKSKVKMEGLSSAKGIRCGPRVICPSPFRTEAGQMAMKELDKFRTEFWRKKESDEANRIWNKPELTFNPEQTHETVPSSFPSMRYSCPATVHDISTQLNPFHIMKANPNAENSSDTTPAEENELKGCTECCPKFEDYDNIKKFYKQYLKEVTLPRLLKAQMKIIIPGELSPHGKLDTFEAIVPKEEHHDLPVILNEDSSFDSDLESKCNSAREAFQANALPLESIKNIDISTVEATKIEDVVVEDTSTKTEALALEKEKHSTVTQKKKKVVSNKMDNGNKRAAKREKSMVTTEKQVDIDSVKKDIISEVDIKQTQADHVPTINLLSLETIELAPFRSKRLIRAKHKHDDSADKDNTGAAITNEEEQKVQEKNTNEIGDQLSETKVVAENKKESDVRLIKVKALTTIPSKAKMEDTLESKPTTSAGDLGNATVIGNMSEAPLAKTDNLRPSSPNFLSAVTNRLLVGKLALTPQQFKPKDSWLSDKNWTKFTPPLGLFSQRCASLGTMEQPSPSEKIRDTKQTPPKLTTTLKQNPGMGKVLKMKLSKKFATASEFKMNQFAKYNVKSDLDFANKNKAKEMHKFPRFLANEDFVPSPIPFMLPPPKYTPPDACFPRPVTVGSSSAIKNKNDGTGALKKTSGFKRPATTMPLSTIHASFIA